jgi:hypothetical protein
VAELKRRSIKGTFVLVLVAICFGLTPTLGLTKSASDESYFNWLAIQIKNNELGQKESKMQSERLSEELYFMRRKSNEYEKALQFLERAILKIERKTGRPYNHNRDKLSLSQLIDESLQLNPLVLYLDFKKRGISSYRQLESILDESEKFREECRKKEDEVKELSRDMQRFNYSRQSLQYRYERAKRGISLEGDWTFVEPKDSSVVRIFWLPKYEKFFGRLIRVSDRLRYQGFPEKHVLWRDIWPIKKRAHHSSAYGKFIDDYEAWEYTFNRGRADREECRLRLSEDGKILWNKSRQQTNTLKRIRAR